MNDDFAERLAAHATTVEACLAEVLAEACEVVPTRLAEAMRHGVLAGGKRLRPFLVIETAGLFGVPVETSVHAAAALECVHCYSLVHDDLPAMDDDRLRRGRPTVWAAYDEWTAILAGDALLTLAFEILSRPQASPAPATRIRLVQALARAAGRAGMVGGQALDLAADKLGEPPSPDEAHVRRLQAMKTGSLILNGVEMGAILADASPADMAALTAYGTALGLAFQIADDLLDAEGDAAVVGKATAKDATAGKATLVSLNGITAARGELAGTIDRAIAALDRLGPRAAALRDAARFVAARRS
ncbi:MAG: polyprenyl synthetase family protein [Hyphomicrobiaceae bacterium]